MMLKGHLRSCLCTRCKQLSNGNTDCLCLFYVFFVFWYLRPWGDSCYLGHSKNSS